MVVGCGDQGRGIRGAGVRARFEGFRGLSCGLGKNSLLSSGVVQSFGFGFRL